jgi:hypothetical protein
MKKAACFYPEVILQKMLSEKATFFLNFISPANKGSLEL